MKEHMIDSNILREVTKGGGMATPYVYIAPTAHLDSGCELRDSAEMYDQSSAYGNTVIRDFAKLFDNARLRDSIARDHARISGLTLAYSSVFQGTVSVLGKAIITDSTIEGNAVISGNAFIEISRIGANTRVADNAKLFNVNTGILDRGETVTIIGSAHLHFPVMMSLQPGTRIHEGYWERPPLVIPTPIFTMVEGVNDRVSIGCLSHTLSFWFKHGKEVLLNYGIEESFYPAFHKAMEEMRDFKKGNPSPKVKKK